MESSQIENSEVFKTIPFFRKYEISKEGVIRIASNKRVLTVRKNGRNFCVTMGRDGGEVTTRNIDGILTDVWGNESADYKIKE